MAKRHEKKGQYKDCPSGKLLSYLYDSKHPRLPLVQVHRHPGSLHHPTISPEKGKWQVGAQQAQTCSRPPGEDQQMGENDHLRTAQ